MNNIREYTKWAQNERGKKSRNIYRHHISDHQVTAKGSDTRLPNYSRTTNRKKNRESKQTTSNIAFVLVETVISEE